MGDFENHKKQRGTRSPFIFFGQQNKGGKKHMRLSIKLTSLIILYEKTEGSAVESLACQPEKPPELRKSLH